MWNIILTDLKVIVAKIEQEAGTAISFLFSFLKEAITEEEAALFPDFQATFNKIMNDETLIAGLNLQARLQLVVVDFSASLPKDIADAKNALINSWAWAIAHQQGLTNGNQGVSSIGDFSGNTNSTPVNPSA